MEDMSDSIFRIWSIARYEAKVIMRGWLFRIAFLLPLAFLSGFFLTSVFRTQLAYSFLLSLYNMPSAIPWIITLFLTVYACIVLAAVSTNSGTLEFQLDTLDGLRVHPWSNVEYAVGKLTGQLICFTIMTSSVMLYTLGIVFFNQKLFIVGPGYLIYPLIVFFPAFFFVTGLSTLVSRVIRNQMFSLLIVMTIVLSSLFLADTYFHLFDITAFRLPLFFSGITGFSFPKLIILHRLIFMSAGLMFVFVAVFIAGRPYGRRKTPVVAAVVAGLFLIISFFSGYCYTNYFSSGIKLRKSIQDVSRSIRPVPRLGALEYEIDVDQDGRSINCVARVVLENNSSTPIERYILTLNPGLEVTGVTGPSGRIEFDREIHLLTVYPSKPLEAGDCDTIQVGYGGLVDERAMYSDVPERIRCADVSFAELTEMDPLRGMKYFRIKREIVPLRDDFILLIPDAMWYPVPGLPYDSKSPSDDYRDFARFRLKVKPREGLSAVSQGKRTNGGKGAFIFHPEYPLPGIMLAIGEFRTRSIEVDSVKYFLHTTPVSESLFEFMECVSDTLPGIIAERKDGLEYTLDLKYPFKRLTCLEVPVAFCPFRRPLRDSGFGYAQPEIFLVHERGLTLGISTVPSWTLDEIHHRKDGKERAEEIRKFWATRAASGYMYTLSKHTKYNITPMFFRHVTGIETVHYPHLGLMFDYFSSLNAVNRERGRYFPGLDFADSERASRFILNGEFLDAVAGPENYRWAGNLINTWASHHYYLIDAMSEGESVARFMRDLVATNMFKNIDEDIFLDSFAEWFGFRLESVIVDLENPVVIPGYIFGGFDCCSFVEGERERFRLSFEAMNREDAAGVIVVTAAMHYPKAQRKMMRRRLNNPVIAVEALEPGESRKIEIEVDFKPMTVWINTMISRNVPSRITWGPRIEIRSSCDGRRFSSESVDLEDFDEESLVVDDQDPGFEVSGGSQGVMLKQLLPFSDDRGEFIDIRGVHRDPPSAWEQIVAKGFFGAYVRSARCIKAGSGDSKAVWRIGIPENGFYDVYCHIFDRLRRYNKKDRSKYGLDRTEYHYTIHHSDGSSEAILSFEQCENGWNLIGRYFFEKGEAVIELSDESPAGYIIADAVKWVKKD